MSEDGTTYGPPPAAKPLDLDALERDAWARPVMDVAPPSLMVEAAVYRRLLRIARAAESIITECPYCARGKPCELIQYQEHVRLRDALEGREP